MLRNLFRRRALEETLDAELRAYVDELTDRNVAKGMPRDEARRQALVETGGIQQVKEEVRGAWIGQGLETSFQDLRRAYRSLTRSPGFTLIVVLTLALGIGANLTIFSLLRAVLWRPLPYPEPDKVVVVQVDARNIANVGATSGELLDLGERSRLLEQVSTINSVEATLEFTDEIERVTSVTASNDFLPLLGARLALGRPLDARIDSSNGQASAILISDELWRRRFFADPAIVGKSVRFNDADIRVKGVLAPGFRVFLPPSISDVEQVDVWLPHVTSPTRQYRGLSILARLRPGVSLDEANAELQILAANFQQEYPDFYAGAKGWQASPSDPMASPGLRFTARSLHEEMTRHARPALFLLAGAVTFVLLIACVNVANLILARGSARQREIDIRRALGAGRSHIVRQLLAESFVLAVASAIIGLGCASFGLQAIARLGASHIPLQSRIGIDGSVALFAIILSMVTSILFGLLPAWRLASGGPVNPLRAGRTQTAGSGARRLQRTLVAAEVALSIVPLVCAGLMLRSFVKLMQAPLGFKAENVVTARIPMNVKRYPHLQQRWAVLQDVIARMRALPGVQSASAASPLPLTGQEKRRVGRADQPGVSPMLATQQFAIPGYLSVMGTPMLEGRDFQVDDVERQRPVTIIDERLAKRLWPEGAIGKRLTVFRTGWTHDLEVIGVTGAVRAMRLRDESIPHFLMPYSEYPKEMSLVVKTRDPAESIAAAIRSAADASHLGRAAFDIRPLTDYVSDSLGDTRFMLYVLAAFAAASVLLAAVGLYGTLAYLTAQRTREFGIRLALGSSVNAIVGIVVRESVLLVSAGALVGLIGAAAAAGAIRELLYEVRPLDAITLASVVGLVAFVALAAASIPACRVTRIDPQESLRSD